MKELRDLKRKLEEAAARLFYRQPNIFEFAAETGQTEWNLAHHLANEIHDIFRDFDCDLDVTKRNYENRRPDIIIHKRGGHTKNFLVIEVKRDGHEDDLRADREKIEGHWFAEPLAYRFGAVINLCSDLTSQVEVFEGRQRVKGNEIMARNSGLDLSEHILPLGIRQNSGILKFAGTGFGFQRRGLVLTASHVVGNATEPDEVYLKLKSGSFMRASHTEHHPEADIAALVFDEDKAPPCFKLGEPPQEYGEFLLSTEISSYGYPYKDEPGGRKTLEPRLMHGRIQRHFQHEWGNPRRRYHAFELSFPALPGQSGSPIFLDHDVHSAIAVLTTNFESSIVLDSIDEHEQDGAREIHKISKIVSYGIGVVLRRHADWLYAL